MYKKECAKKVIRLLKHLRNEAGGQAKKIKSFMIKVVVMKEILRRPENYWNNRNLDNCFIDCLHALKDGLAQKSISAIFYPKVDKKIKSSIANHFNFQLNLVDRLDDQVLENNVRWLENLLKKFKDTGDISTIFNNKR